jgi:hypothetical protein
MTEPRSDDRIQARREAATLLGVDVEHLSPADNLRVDMVSALRLVIDAEQASVLDGGQSDLGKLNVAVQSLIALLPNRELPEPALNRIDPRQIMWETYIGMRRRGELAASYLSPQQRLEAARAKVAEIEAELGSGSTGANSAAVIPTEVVPPGEWRGVPPMPGPDDPKPPVTIEGKAAPAAPAEDMVDLRAGYNDVAEPWREHLNRHYDPWADNRN